MSGSDSGVLLDTTGVPVTVSDGMVAAGNLGDGYAQDVQFGQWVQFPDGSYEKNPYIDASGYYHQWQEPGRFVPKNP